jgi:hypothetical protein
MEHFRPLSNLNLVHWNRPASHADASPPNRIKCCIGVRAEPSSRCGGHGGGGGGCGGCAHGGGCAVGGGCAHGGGAFGPWLFFWLAKKAGLKKSPIVFAITFHPTGRRYISDKRMNVMEKIFALVSVAFAFLAGVTVYSDQPSACVGPNCVNSCAGNDC